MVVRHNFINLPIPCLQITVGSGRSGALWGKVRKFELSPEEGKKYRQKLERAAAKHHKRHTVMA